MEGRASVPEVVSEAVVLLTELREYLLVRLDVSLDESVEILGTLEIFDVLMMTEE